MYINSIMFLLYFFVALTNNKMNTDTPLAAIQIRNGVLYIFPMFYSNIYLFVIQKREFDCFLNLLVFAFNFSLHILENKQ